MNNNNNQDSLNSIWSSKYNSNESLTKPDSSCHMPLISIDINEFEMHESQLQSVLSESGAADNPNDKRFAKGDTQLSFENSTLCPA